MLHYSLSSACSSWLASSSQLPLKWLIQYKALACSVGSLVDQLSYWKPPAEFRREYRRGGMPRSDRGLFEMALLCSKKLWSFLFKLSLCLKSTIRSKRAGINPGIETTCVLPFIITIISCAIQRAKRCLGKQVLVTLFHSA